MNFRFNMKVLGQHVFVLYVGSKFGEKESIRRRLVSINMIVIDVSRLQHIQ